MTQAAGDQPREPAKNITVTVNQTAGAIESGGSLVGVAINNSTVYLQVQRVHSLHQLPAPPADFTGRAAELADLRSALTTAETATTDGRPQTTETATTDGGPQTTGRATTDGRPQTADAESRPPSTVVRRPSSVVRLPSSVARPPSSVVLRGMGGVGKTALALVLAHELQSQYPDAQFFIDMRGLDAQPTTTRAAMEQVIRGYAGADAKLPDDPEQLAGTYRDVLNGQRALLVFDNAKDAAQVEPLLPPQGCLALITSRRELYLPAMFELHMDALPAADAEALLLKLAPRAAADAPAIAHVCANLPLALTLAGKWLREHRTIPPSAYLERCGDVSTRLRLTGTDIALQVSYEALREDGGEALQAAWRALSVFPATFELSGAAAVWAMLDGVKTEAAAQTVNADAQDQISLLDNASLVQYDEATQRYSLHDLAREFARAKLSDAERDSAARRHAAYYVQVLIAANDAYLQGSAGVSNGLALFDRERANIEAGRAWATAQPESDEGAAQLTSQYPNAGLYLLDLRLSRSEQIRWLEQALAAARRLQDHLTEGAHLSNLGLAYADLGEPRRAIEYHEQALAVMRASGDRRGEGRTLGNLGLVYADLGETQHAIELYEQSLVVVRELGDKRAESSMLGNLGGAYYALDDPHRAIEYNEQSLVIDRALGDRLNEGNSLGNLGLAYAGLGEPRRAIEYHEQHLAIARELGDRRGEGNALGNLGNAYSDLGERAKAVDYYEQALVIDRETGDRRGEGTDLRNLADEYDRLGERAKAIANAEAALKIFKEIEDPNADELAQALAAWKTPS